MRKARSFLTLAILSLVTALFTAAIATAENYPIRPVKMIVPYPPGGGNDIIARILAQKLSETGGRPYMRYRMAAPGNNDFLARLHLVQKLT